MSSAARSDDVPLFALRMNFCKDFIQKMEEFEKLQSCKKTPSKECFSLANKTGLNGSKGEPKEIASNRESEADETVVNDFVTQFLEVNRNNREEEFQQRLLEMLSTFDEEKLTNLHKILNTKPKAFDKFFTKYSQRRRR